MDTLRNHLRTATVQHHERVDAAFSSFELGKQNGYRAFLQAHAQVLIPLEAALERAGIAAMIEDWTQRRRASALRADLADLGAVVPSPAPHEMPSSPAWCWGATYVIEGSRLGGRVLARRVADADPSAPLRYLSHSSASPLWPSFLEKLELHAATCDWSDVLAGAHDTFERFLAAARAHRP